MAKSLIVTDLNDPAIEPKPVPQGSRILYFKKSGRLIYLWFVGMRNHNALWMCQCSCGRMVMVQADRFGKSKSCGCIRTEKSRAHIMRVNESRRLRCRSKNTGT